MVGGDGGGGAGGGGGGSRSNADAKAATQTGKAIARKSATSDAKTAKQSYASKASVSSSKIATSRYKGVSWDEPQLRCERHTSKFDLVL